MYTDVEIMNHHVKIKTEYAKPLKSEIDQLMVILSLKFDDMDIVTSQEHRVLKIYFKNETTKCGFIFKGEEISTMEVVSHLSLQDNRKILHELQNQGYDVNRRLMGFVASSEEAMIQLLKKIKLTIM